MSKTERCKAGFGARRGKASAKAEPHKAKPGFKNPPIESFPFLKKGGLLIPQNTILKTVLTTTPPWLNNKILSLGLAIFIANIIPKRNKKSRQVTKHHSFVFITSSIIPYSLASVADK